VCKKEVTKYIYIQLFMQSYKCMGNKIEKNHEQHINVNENNIHVYSCIYIYAGT